MRSIRLQLVTWLVGGTLVLTCAACMGLYEYMEEVLERGLDAAINAKAQAVIGAVHIEDDGQPHLQSSELSTSIAMRHEGPFYFQIWRVDGSTLARVAPPAWGETSLPRMTNNRRHFSDARLPDQTSGRITELTFLTRWDDNEFDTTPRKAAPAPVSLTLVVAHDRRSIDGSLAVLMGGLLLSQVVVAIGIVVIVTVGVRRGLRPLAEVSALADRIGPDTMDVRFPGAGKLPPELLPIGLKLNDLIDRLSTAFARERRFSAAVAHELRTPLAELRSACDVGLRWPDDSEGLKTALTEARDVAVHMSAMVQILLSLTRQQAEGARPTAVRPIRLAEAVASACPELPTAAARRQLAMTQELDPTAVVEANPDLLVAVLRNLTENAVDYTPTGGSVVIRTQRANDDRWSLHISNNCEGLTAENLPRLFEPFWRADAARAGDGHFGLGLSLVKAYCNAMQVSIDSVLDAPDRLTMVVVFPGGPDHRAGL